MSKVLLSFLEDESGATAIEYAVIALLLSLAGILGLQALGGSLSQAFAAISSDLLALSRD